MSTPTAGAALTGEAEAEAEAEFEARAEAAAGTEAEAAPEAGLETEAEAAGANGGAPLPSRFELTPLPGASPAVVASAARRGAAIVGLSVTGLGPMRRWRKLDNPAEWGCGAAGGEGMACGAIVMGGFVGGRRERWNAAVGRGGWHGMVRRAWHGVRMVWRGMSVGMASSSRMRCPWTDLLVCR